MKVQWLMCLTIALLLSLLDLTFGLVDFRGRWKEDQYQRHNLGDFLYDVGMPWYKRWYIRTINWANEQTIYQNGNDFRINGYQGPMATVFSHHFIADNKTVTEIAMNEIGGVMITTAEIDENDRLKVYMIQKSSGQLYYVSTRTLKEGSKELLDELKHIPSGSVLISNYRKQG